MMFLIASSFFNKEIILKEQVLFFDLPIDFIFLFLLIDIVEFRYTYHVLIKGESFYPLLSLIFKRWSLQD